MKSSFESHALEKHYWEKMYEKARVLIDEQRMHEDDLREIYGEEVTADLEKVNKLKERFAQGEEEESQEAKKLADIFEAIVLDSGELSEWFGEDAFTIKTSLYDDYINGVDMVVEFRGEGEEEAASYLGVAADVTFSNQSSKKFDRIKEHIDNGELGKVKYFSSEHMETKGELRKLPEVVIGVSKKTLVELAELWASRNHKEMAKHYAQLMILRQIREQLDVYALYAESIGKQELSALFKARLAVVDSILSTKKDIDKESGWNVDLDTVHSDIMNFLKSWRKTVVSGKAAA